MENNNEQRLENSPKTARIVAMLVASASATTIFTVAISPITVTNAKKHRPPGFQINVQNTGSQLFTTSSTHFILFFIRFTSL